MKAARLGSRTRLVALCGAAVLIVCASAATAPAQARGEDAGASALAARQPTTGSPDGRPDPTFTPARRREAIEDAGRRRAATARHLRLGAQQALRVRDVVRDVDGTEHVRYDRTYAGLPVVGGDLVVEQAPGGDVRDVAWATRAKVEVPSTRAAVAGAAARLSAARRSGLRAADTAPVKVVFGAGREPVLAWQTTVVGTGADGTPVRDLVYTDARSGRQLARYPQIENATGSGRSLYSGTVSLRTELSGSTYRLVDTARARHATYDAKNSTSGSRGTLFTDGNNVWGDGTTSSRQTVAVDAAYGAARTWDFFRSQFGRTGIRNDGVAAYSRVHFGKGYENAFWEDGCFCMTYGDGGAAFRPLPSLDVSGHEMSHGVTGSTAHLVYEGDPGGLNEATSDVFGTMVEFQAANSKDPGDYYIGEKVVRDGTYLRRMDNPALDGHSRNCWSSTVRDLDPHYSSGVGNHLFYLLAEGTGAKTIGGRPHNGTTCNGTTLTGIGRSKAAAIWYRALTTQWVSTTSYPRAANGMVRAAKDLYGAGSNECTTTLRAWQGVKVTPTETCTDTVTDSGDGNLLANPGFELGVTSWNSTSGVITRSTMKRPNSGSYYAWLNGYDYANTDSVNQSVAIPSASSATLTFYLYVDSSETATTRVDTLRVQVVSGTTATTLATYSNLDAGDRYEARSVDLSAYAGRTVTVRLIGVADASERTSFLVDDLSLRTG